MSFKKRLEAFRGRLCGTAGCLLGHPLVISVLLTVSGNILTWLAKAFISGLLLYAGITISTN